MPRIAYLEGTLELMRPSKEHERIKSCIGRLVETYRRLGIGEIWFWQASRIEVHVLRQQGYERTDRSSLFPDLDLELL